MLGRVGRRMPRALMLIRIGATRHDLESWRWQVTEKLDEFIGSRTRSGALCVADMRHFDAINRGVVLRGRSVATRQIDVE